MERINPPNCYKIHFKKSPSKPYLASFYNLIESHEEIYYQFSDICLCYENIAVK